MTHRIGIIGLGIMGQRMLAAMTAHPTVSVAAAWDPSQSACAALRAAHPEIAIPASAEALAAREDIAAVYIASPPISHPAYVDLAWDNGKVAFCEKPLAVDVTSSQALVARETQQRQRAAINFPFATAPAARALRDAVANGSLGTIESIAIEVAFAAWPRDWQQAGRWLSERAEGGFTREVVSHFMFLTQRLAGPLTVLDARATYPADGVTAETALTARLSAGAVPVTLNGAVGTISAPESNSLTMTGSKGAMRLHGWINLARAAAGGWEEVDFGHGPPLRQRAAKAQLDALIALIDGKAHPLATLSEGLAVQSCIEEMLRPR